MYNYTSKNLLVYPEKYFYTSFEGQKFIDAYFKSRTIFLEGFHGENQDLSSWIEHLNLPNNINEVSTCHILHDFLITKQKKELIDVLQRKFEVTKKIYDFYDLKSFRPIEKKSNILNYILFGVVLINLYEESRFMGYLNSLLKINDIIISQEVKEVAEFTSVIREIICKELEFIKEL